MLYHNTAIFELLNHCLWSKMKGYYFMINYFCCVSFNESKAQILSLGMYNYLLQTLHDI